jgi:hypothetical protein
MCRWRSPDPEGPTRIQTGNRLCHNFVISLWVEPIEVPIPHYTTMPDTIMGLRKVIMVSVPLLGRLIAEKVHLGMLSALS